MEYIYAENKVQTASLYIPSSFCAVLKKKKKGKLKGFRFKITVFNVYKVISRNNNCIQILH